MANMILHNKFKVVKTAKTKAAIFKDLSVGQIIEISTPIHTQRSCGSSSRGIQAHYVYIDGQGTLMSTFESMIFRGFEFAEMEAGES